MGPDEELNEDEIIDDETWDGIEYEPDLGISDDNWATGTLDVET